MPGNQSEDWENNSTTVMEGRRCGDGIWGRQEQQVLGEGRECWSGRERTECRALNKQTLLQSHWWWKWEGLITASFYKWLSSETEVLEVMRSLGEGWRVQRCSWRESGQRPGSRWCDLKLPRSHCERQFPLLAVHLGDMASPPQGQKSQWVPLSYLSH